MKKNLLLPLFVLICSTAFAQYVEGRYYTHDGQKVEGLVEHVYQARFGKTPDNYIMFRPEKGAKKTKLTTKDIQSFAIGKDSFVVIKNFELNSMAKYNEDFARVIKSGKINLYLFYTTKGTDPTPVRVYLAEKNGKIVTMHHKDDLEQNLNTFFGDDKEFARKIQGNKLKGNEIEKIVEEYNTRNK